MKRFIILLSLLIFQVQLFSQNPFEDFLGSWYTYSGNHRLTERISLSSGTHLRYYEPSSNYNLALFYLTKNYHINQKSTIAIGYAFLDIDTVFEFDHATNVKEYRIYEQYIYKHKLNAFKIQHRFLLEQRFLDFGSYNEIWQQFRYRLSFKYDINKAFFLVLSEEPFVNFQNQVFHENRFYTGIGINVLKHSQLQIGYLKQHIRKNNLNRIQVGISIQTDHRKPKTTLANL